MPLDGYIIPAARGPVHVTADNPAVSAEVAEAVANFTANFEKWKADHGGDVEALRAELFDLQQRLADGLPSSAVRGGAGRSPSATLAQQLIKNAEWQAVADRKATRTSVNVDSGLLLPVEANTITRDGGHLNLTDTQPGIVTVPKRRRWLRERFPTVPTTGNTVEYHRMLTFSNAAAPQGGGSPHVFEGTDKPETTMTFEPVTVPVQTVAHWIKASKQIMADAGMLGMTIDTQLRYGLELAVEAQIITGNGVGSNFSGLTKPGNYTAFTPSSGDSAIDSINRSLADIETAEGMPNLIVMHPQDYRAMQRVKATGGSEEYLFGSPSGANTANVWNTEIHTTPSMTQGKFMTLDTVQAAVIFWRADATVVPGWVNDDFTKNLVTILAENRLCIGVQQPAMVRYGDLTTG